MLLLLVPLPTYLPHRNPASPHPFRRSRRSLLASCDGLDHAIPGDIPCCYACKTQNYMFSFVARWGLFVARWVFFFFFSPVTVCRHLHVCVKRLASQHTCVGAPCVGAPTYTLKCYTGNWDHWEHTGLRRETVEELRRW